MPTAFPLAHSKEEFEKFNNENRCSGAYTEIIIDAPPSVVRSKFLDFETRSTWDPFFRKIQVTKGSLDKDENEDPVQPEISLVLDMIMDGKEAAFPMSLKVSCNDEKTFVWGLCIALCGYVLFKADHAHLFLPSDETGKSTRFVQYERIVSVGQKYVVDEANLLKAYELGNAGLKKVCEEDS